MLSCFVVAPSGSSSNSDRAAMQKAEPVKARRRARARRTHDKEEATALADSDDSKPLGPKPPSPCSMPYEFVDGVAGPPTALRDGMALEAWLIENCIR